MARKESDESATDVTVPLGQVPVPDGDGDGDDGMPTATIGNIAPGIEGSGPCTLS